MSTTNLTTFSAGFYHINADLQHAVDANIVTML